MKRYKSELREPWMKEHQEGEWVQYRDMTEISAKSFKDGVNHGRQESSKGCNCYEEVKRGSIGRRIDNWWICPAHGYKKL